MCDCMSGVGSPGAGVEGSHELLDKVMGIELWSGCMPLMAELFSLAAHFLITSLMLSFPQS